MASILGVFARRQMMVCKYAQHDEASCQENSLTGVGMMDSLPKHNPVKICLGRLTISIICYIFAALKDHYFEKYEKDFPSYSFHDSHHLRCIVCCFVYAEEIQC